MLTTSIIVILISYALGCISVGYYLVRWRTGQDLHKIGSGATGGRNAGRALGRTGAIITGIGDILKGALAMGIALKFNIALWAIGLVMISVLAGHIWPIQLGFKGGKGLSVAFGAVLVYDYRIAVLTAIIALTLLMISGQFRHIGFLIGVGCSTIVAVLLGHGWEIVTALVIVVCIILFAHRDNIRQSIQERGHKRELYL